MDELKAIIFDVDGTLAETERDGHRVAFNRAFSEVGLDWYWSNSLYGELLAISGGKERLRYYLERDRPDFDPPGSLDDWIVAVHKRKNHHYQELLAEGAIPPRPGVKRLIEEARDRDIRLAIATTSALPNAMAVLEQTLDPSWFEVVAAGDVVPEKKPAPDIYYYALEQLQLTPRDCVAIEDSRHGLAAARAAGLTTIVTVNDYTQNQDFAEAALVLNHLGEPDRPFQVRGGAAKDSTYLDVDLLRHLH
ncbi:MAG: HAD-IA family hydrolase, partial [Limnospira sp.]